MKLKIGFSFVPPVEIFQCGMGHCRSEQIAVRDVAWPLNRA